MSFNRSYSRSPAATATSQDAEPTRITGEVVELHPKSGDTWTRAKVNRGTSSVWLTCKYRLDLGQVIDVLCSFNAKFKSYDVIRNAGTSGVVSNEVVVTYIVKTLPGVGAVKAGYLSKAAGQDKLFDGILANPQWVADAVGAKIEDVNTLVQELNKYRAEFADVSSLTNYGYTPAIAKAITQLGLVDAALQSPYPLIPLVTGLGWKLADEVGRKQGIALDAPERVVAGIVHFYNEEVRGQGCTIVSLDELCGSNGAAKFLSVGSDLIREHAVNALIPVGDDLVISKQDLSNEQTIQEFFGI